MAKKYEIKDVWRCTKCKGTNVQIISWVNPNTNETDRCDDIDINEQWCQDCEEHVELEIVKKRVPIK